MIEMKNGNLYVTAAGHVLECVDIRPDRWYMRVKRSPGQIPFTQVGCGAAGFAINQEYYYTHGGYFGGEENNRGWGGHLVREIAP